MANLNFTLTVEARVRWWYQPLIWTAKGLVWLAGRLASFAVNRGIATRVR